MKEKVDPVGQNLPDSSENKKKIFSVEAQASLHKTKEIDSQLADGKKLDSCFRETNDTNTATHKLLQLQDMERKCLPPNGEEQLQEALSSVNYISQESCEPNDNGIIMEFDESGEGHTEVSSNGKSTLNCCDETSRVIGHSKIVQSIMPYVDLKASEFEPSTRVTDLISRHSSMVLGYPSEIGEIDKPTATGVTMDLQDDESKDFVSSTPSLVDLVKVTSIESPEIDLDDSISDNNGGTTNIKEAVLESCKCKDELASIIEKDFNEISLLNTGAVDGDDIYEQEVIANFLLASPVNCDESYLHREVGETCTMVGISSDLVTYAPNSASINISSVAITAKSTELEACFLKSIMDGSELSHSPLSGTAACGMNEPVPLSKLLEEHKRQFQASGTSDAYSDEDMETIDLDDNVELQESCARIDVRDLLAISEHVKSFRSIKRKILDAFTSRRRTAKEYEQLGILHGYVDFDPDRPLMRDSVPFQDVRTSVEHPDDSDWELV